MMDPDPYPDPHLINADPKPWMEDRDSNERKVREREIEGERNCCYKKNHTGSGSGVGSGISDETSL